MWYVYIVQTKSGNYYVGITTNPKARLHMHNTGRGSQIAKQQGPVKLVYTSKSFPTKSEARVREVQLKGWSRIKKEKLIKGIWN